jgi:hypothetical protein
LYKVLDKDKIPVEGEVIETINNITNSQPFFVQSSVDVLINKPNALIGDNLFFKPLVKKKKGDQRRKRRKKKLTLSFKRKPLSDLDTNMLLIIENALMKLSSLNLSKHVNSNDYPISISTVLIPYRFPIPEEIFPETHLIRSISSS